MKHSILFRILTSCLLSLFLIFSLIVLTINRVVYRQIAASADEKSQALAAETTRQITDVHTNVTGLLDFLSVNLANIDPAVPNADEMVKDLVQAMLKTTPFIHCVWFVFEEGDFYTDDTFDTDFVKDLKGNIVEITDLEDEEMNDPELSKWYWVPLLEGKVYFLIADYFDYGLTYGSKYTDTVSAPIVRDGKTIGVIGIDTLYDDTFRFLREKQVENEQTALLVTGEGEIVYAPDGDMLASSLFDWIHMPQESKESLLAQLGTDEPFTIEAALSFSGVRSNLYFSPVYTDSEETGMYLLLDLPLDALFARATNTTRTIALLSCAGMLLLGGGLLIIVRSILKPVKKLTENANMLASGNLDVDFASKIGGANDPAESKNEIVLLTSALKKMLDRLHQGQAAELWAMREMAEAKEAEQRLVRENAVLDRMNRMKNEFFQNMSHDFKTPLTVISVNILDTADMLDFAIDAGEMRRNLQDAQREIMRMARMVDGAMKYSSMHDNQQDMVPLNIATLLREGAETYRALLEGNGNALALDIPESLPPISGNADMLLLVLSNLLSNANRYTRNGTITISAAERDGRVTVTVRDSGSGVKPEILPHVFERGVSEGGTGLGLSICKAAVEAHNGTISIESEYGKGTKITFSIPSAITASGG